MLGSWFTMNFTVGTDEAILLRNPWYITIHLSCSAVRFLVKILLNSCLEDRVLVDNLLEAEWEMEIHLILLFQDGIPVPNWLGFPVLCFALSGFGRGSYLCKQRGIRDIRIKYLLKRLPITLSYFRPLYIDLLVIPTSWCQPWAFWLFCHINKAASRLSLLPV